MKKLLLILLLSFTYSLFRQEYNKEYSYQKVVKQDTTEIIIVYADTSYMDTDRKEHKRLIGYLLWQRGYEIKINKDSSLYLNSFKQPFDRFILFTKKIECYERK
jgi:hypothetical protein